ncbi:hypothetical protein BJ741DRAFT_596946 [Chytriomyces cf. hyalinus JEL632]|nr:hypothetical protein BJ741DRAFT_596946 [Chytriomyces cf. hyalinus JEL632]
MPWVHLLFGADSVFWMFFVCLFEPCFARIKTLTASSESASLWKRSDGFVAVRFLSWEVSSVRSARSWLMRRISVGKCAFASREELLRKSIIHQMESFLHAATAVVDAGS